MRKTIAWDEKRGRDLFVTEDKSYRDIAKILGVSHSTLAARGRKDDWPGQRLAYKASVARRVYEDVANAVADEKVQIKLENVAISRAYLRTFAQDLVSGKIVTNAKDAQGFILLLAKELAAETVGETKDGPKVIEGTTREADDAFLRRVVEAARGGVAAPGSPGPGVLVGPSGTGPH